MSKLKVLASLSGGGKSTFANENYDPLKVLPDTNQNMYKVYHKLFYDPAMSMGTPMELLTGIALFGAKYNADLTYFKTLKDNGIPLEGNYLNMRSGFDYLVYDEMWMKRQVIPDEVMHKFAKEVEDNFDEVDYEIWVMRDQEIIAELMAKDDDRAILFEKNPDVYNRWQDNYVNRYEGILKKFGYNYILKEVKYRY